MCNSWRACSAWKIHAPVTVNELANKNRYSGLAASGNFQCALGLELDAWGTTRLALGLLPCCFTPLHRLLLFNKGSAEAFKIEYAATPGHFGALAYLLHPARCRRSAGFGPNHLLRSAVAETYAALRTRHCYFAFSVVCIHHYK
jgi:hypothetical protein